MTDRQKLPTNPVRQRHLTEREWLQAEAAQTTQAPEPTPLPDSARYWANKWEDATDTAVWLLAESDWGRDLLTWTACVYLHIQLWLLHEARWERNQSAANESRLAIIMYTHTWLLAEARWWAEWLVAEARWYPDLVLPWETP